MSMATTVIALCLVALLITIVSPINQRRRAKRIAFGEPVPSMDTYKTYYFVQVRQTWACTTDQTDHESQLSTCQHDQHWCGGTLVHPEFVLTAAHCIMYYQVQLKTKGAESIKEWIKDKGTQEKVWYEVGEAWKKFERWVTGLVIVPKPRHVVYSDWSLYMGSHDAYKMTQKRHVTKVFPHRKFPMSVITTWDKLDLQDNANAYHDISLLRTCEPFNIKKGEVEIAPMLETAELLREQFERVVREGMVCLYIGFGDQLEASNNTVYFGHPVYPSNLLLHTWRSSMCSVDCNYYQIEPGSKPHTCHLCSTHHGDKLGGTQHGDSGSPVTCERYFVATLTKGTVVEWKNYTQSVSYPLHCIKNSIHPLRLEYYKKVVGNDYHPLEGTKLRRLRMPLY